MLKEKTSCIHIGISISICIYTYVLLKSSHKHSLCCLTIFIATLLMNINIRDRFCLFHYLVLANITTMNLLTHIVSSPFFIF